MRIIIDCTDPPSPRELVLQLETVCTVHDPDAQVTMVAEPMQPHGRS